MRREICAGVWLREFFLENSFSSPLERRNEWTYFCFQKKRNTVGFRPGSFVHIKRQYTFTKASYSIKYIFRPLKFVYNKRLSTLKVSTKSGVYHTCLFTPTLQRLNHIDARNEIDCLLCQRCWVWEISPTSPWQSTCDCCSAILFRIKC